MPFAGQAIKELEIPYIINAYNSMNSVDIGDQLQGNSYHIVQTGVHVVVAGRLFTISFY